MYGIFCDDPDSGDPIELATAHDLTDAERVRDDYTGRPGIPGIPFIAPSETRGRTTMQTTLVELDRVHAEVKGVHAEVKAEIARTDTKAGLLLALEGAAAAGLWTAATARPLPAVAVSFACVSGAFIAAAVVVLLLAVRPRLGGRLGFPLWATLTPAELRDHLAEQDLAEDVTGLSRLATAKFHRLQHAIDLTLAAIAPAVLAIAATLVAR